MGKFGKFGGGDRLLQGNAGREANKSLVTNANEEIARVEARADARNKGDVHRLIYGDAAKIAIALDATGSMAGLLQSARASIFEIMERAKSEAGRPIEIEIFVYRDYDVPQQLLERSGASPNAGRLSQWLARVIADGGGGNDGEAVEAALAAILADGTFATVLLAGDEPSNSAASLAAAGRRNNPTALSCAQALGQKKIPVHTFVVGNYHRTVEDFAAIAKASNGKTGRLDGSAEMIDLAVMAILARVKGASGVRDYMASRPLTSNSRDFGQLLLGSSQ